MPASLTYPGVYIEELPSNVHSIAGVATSIAAFIGWAPQGPTDKAVLVESFTQFQSIFGGFVPVPGVYLAYAVNQFFANGGSQAYIIRLVWDGSLTAAPGTNPAVASTAVAAGIGFASAQITASVGSVVSPAITIDVGARVLQSLVIGPANLPVIPLGAEVTLTASGVFSDGTTGAPPGQVNWSSNNPAIPISSTGLLTANSAGSVVVTAQSGPLSTSTSLTVGGASVATLALNPATFSLAAGQTQQLSAIATLSDGTTQDVTPLVSWTFAATALSISGGDATPLPGATGSQTITASLATVASPVTSTGAVASLGPAIPVSLAVYPAGAVANIGQLVDFSARATNSDGTVGALGGGSWTSSVPTVATVASPSGVATLDAVGTTVVTVTSGALTASATLTVTAATLKSLSVTPLASTVASGHNVSLSAKGLYSDGSTYDLTQSVSWSPATAIPAASPATTNTADPNTGLVTTGAVGSTTITATVPWQTATTATAQVTVTAPVIASLAITPLASPLLSGQSAALTLTAKMSNSSAPPSPIPGVTWSSSAPSIVSVNSAGVATSVAAGGSLTLFASSPGAWGNSLRVSVLAQPPQPSQPPRFGLLVQQVSSSGQLTTLESFVGLSTTSTDPQYAVTVIDNDSNYITFINPATNAPVVPSATPSPTSSPIALSGGSDGAQLIPAGDQNFELALSNAGGGFNLLDRIDIFNLLCVPGETDETAISQMQAYCATKRAMLIVDPPQTATAAGLASSGPVGTNRGAGITTLPNSANSAYYFPWIYAPDPAVGNKKTLYPPCGFVAGIYAATNSARGVWKAPAGVTAGLSGDLGLQFVLSDAENGNLNPQAINCLRHFKVYGDVVWGARTLAGNDQVGSQWKYVPIRRLALYIESSLFDGTQWVVFEPNAEPLWGQIRLNVGSFMQGLFLEGAFAGSSPQTAYFVKCDADNNPPASVALGVVNILVGFAPLYPAEFVVIQIQQIAAQGS